MLVKLKTYTTIRFILLNKLLLVMKNIKIFIKNLSNLIHYLFSTLPSNNNFKLSHDKKLLNDFYSQSLEIEYKKDYSKYLKAFNLPENSGGINIGDQKALYFITKIHMPIRILELGTHIGCSTINFLIASQNNKNFENLTTVDIVDVNDKKISNWKKYHSSFSPKEMSEKINMQDKITFVNDFTDNFLKKNEQKYNLIFIDAGHSFDKAYKDLYLSTNFLEDDGIIIMHDIYQFKHFSFRKSYLNGPYLALKKISKKFNFEINLLHSLPWRTKDEGNLTSLGILKLIK
tara:strand:+ start:2399 stop:3262 length:864 start_codon:yes stop_codon:yes gene_type:complete